MPRFSRDRGPVGDYWRQLLSVEKPGGQSPNQGAYAMYDIRNASQVTTQAKSRAWDANSSWQVKKEDTEFHATQKARQQLPRKKDMTYQPKKSSIAEESPKETVPFKRKSKTEDRIWRPKNAEAISRPAPQEGAEGQPKKEDMKWQPKNPNSAESPSKETAATKRTLKTEDKIWRPKNTDTADVSAPKKDADWRVTRENAPWNAQKRDVTASRSTATDRATEQPQKQDVQWQPSNPNRATSPSTKTDSAPWLARKPDIEWEPKMPRITESVSRKMESATRVLTKSDIPLAHIVKPTTATDWRPKIPKIPEIPAGGRFESGLKDSESMLYRRAPKAVWEGTKNEGDEESRWKDDGWVNKWSRNEGESDPWRIGHPESVGTRWIRPEWKADFSVKANMWEKEWNDKWSSEGASYARSSKLVNEWNDGQKWKNDRKEDGGGMQVTSNEWRHDASWVQGNERKDNSGWKDWADGRDEWRDNDLGKSRAESKDGGNEWRNERTGEGDKKWSSASRWKDERPDAAEVSFGGDLRGKGNKPRNVSELGKDAGWTNEPGSKWSRDAISAWKEATHAAPTRKGKSY
eukprot:GEMP01015478.1.p1 GENE.GEMP01015478.1~~GEMP01015478.1.p1  ORF type:complete len:577 (-),score=142.57 GEMP01015478.1:1137-2867(-)